MANGTAVCFDQKANVTNMLEIARSLMVRCSLFTKIKHARAPNPNDGASAWTVKADLFKESDINVKRTKIDIYAMNNNGACC